MASEIRVDKINSLSGVGTVTLSPTGVDISGITTAATLKATTGIVTTLTATTGIVTTLTTNTTRATTGIVTTLTATTGIVTTLTTNTLTANSTAKVGSGVTLSPDGDVFVTGVTTSSTVKVGGGVTISESGIEASGIGITCASINGGQIGGRKNIIINGAMQVAQRGTSGTALGYGSVDRIQMIGANLDQLAFAQKQTSDGPDGFSKCFEFDVTTVENALDADDLVYAGYRIEGQDLEQFFNANGTGKDFTISFYVKAYQAGTYQFNIYKSDGPRFIAKTYTVDASATWQRVVIPITGDTNTTGMLATTGSGFNLSWIFAAGTNYTSGSTQTTWGTWPGNTGFAAGQAVNTASSTDNYFRITGIQLELGSQATAFEHRSYGEELSLCQRYYFVTGSYAYGGSSWHPNGAAAEDAYGSARFPTTMRASPTIVLRDANGNVDGKVTQWGAAHDIAATASYISETGFQKIIKSSGTFNNTTNWVISAGYTADAEI